MSRCELTPEELSLLLLAISIELSRGLTVEQQVALGNIFFSLGQNIFLISSVLALKQKSNENSSKNNGNNNIDIESEIKALKKKIKELENKT
ncbi:MULTISPECIES: hypothetical protein [unclassified Clostridium]|uniref:hypothetical protein n=1 Tax=unclassified Clostridium TaxID=2614128 RepID=UPI0025C1F3C0|nr:MULTISPECIES: hypothetical protein [unclassified Clostridium]